MNDPAFGRRELAKVLDGIAQQHGLPASALTVRSTVDLSGDQDRAVHELTRAVLEDPVLTERVLRAANSAAFAIPGGVQTVTHAIFVLGYDAIRTIALSMSLLERIELPRQRELLELELGQAVAAACTARELAAAAGYEAEPTEVVAMMRALGRMTVAAWAPDGYLAVRRRARHDATPEAHAARRVLGQSFNAIAQVAARAWGFDEAFVALIGRDADSSRGHARVAALAVDLVEAATQDGSTRGPRSGAVASFAGHALDLTDERVRQALQAAQARTAALCDALMVPDPTGERAQALLARLLAEPEPDSIEPQDENAVPDGSGRAAEPNAPDVAPPRVEPPEPLSSAAPPPLAAVAPAFDAAGRPPHHREQLAAGAAALTQAVRDGQPPETLLSLALDTMHRSMGFQRTVVALRDDVRRAYRPRLARGAGIERIMRWGLALDGRDILRAAVDRDVSLNIADVSVGKVRAGLPPRFNDAFPDVASFVLLPLRLGDMPFGFVYADRNVPDRLTDQEDIRLLTAIRDALQPVLPLLR